MARGGYAWWYLDALSDDGAHGLTLIAFVGSVFSPYYALARRRGGLDADPLAHCAFNVALYGRGGHRWAMTERGSGRLQRAAEVLRIGRSGLAWQADGSLRIDIDEVTAPWPSRIRGTVHVEPQAFTGFETALDAAGTHRWRPIAPCARVTVALDAPRQQWSGHGYLDSNDGDAPLESSFAHWTWARAALPDAGGTAVVYDVERLDGTPYSLALHFGTDGRATPFAAPPAAQLPKSGWRLAQQIRCEAGAAPEIASRLEDGPFYARSTVRTRLLGEAVTAVHESLSLRRFASPLVQAMLPFRMPRRGG